MNGKGIMWTAAAMMAVATVISGVRLGGALRQTEEKAAETKARAEQIDIFLDEANAAKARGDWSTVAVAAGQMLKLDAGSVIGRQLRAEAAAHLRPVLKVRAFIGQEEITGATIVLNNAMRAEKTPAQFPVEKGRRYTVQVSLPGGRDHKTYAEFATEIRIERNGPLELRAMLAEQTMRVPAGCRAAPGTAAEPYSNTGWAKEIIHVKTGVEMVYIPAGSFTMGSLEAETSRADDGTPQRVTISMLEFVYIPMASFTTSSPTAEVAWDNDETQHQVTISTGFYLGKYEVTQGQWQALTGNNPAYFMLSGKEAPVEQVSWNECREFCDKLGSGFRLPTESEWEYACRAGTTGTFAGVLNDLAWYSENSGGMTHHVGIKAANAWGLHDMHGNVWEWCADWYGYYPTGAVTDPVGPGSGLRRINRGGGWGSGDRNCRAADRSRGGPASRGPDLGLRLAWTIPAQ